MASAKKTMSERAVDRLEEQGYLKKVRAEIRAELMECLVELEEHGQIPVELRIKRYTPEEDKVKEVLGHIHQFLRVHQMENTLTCLSHEVNGQIKEPDRLPGQLTSIAAAIAKKPKQ
jgi:DNA-binding Lrp family transcriptional regulator